MSFGNQKHESHTCTLYLQVTSCFLTVLLSQLMKYMESLPPAVKPKNGSEGAKYRRKQMMYQLPIHDHDENYCDNLTEPERASMRQFCDDRNQNALGVGDVREKTNPVSKWVSKQIHGS